ncbi:MAG TPA: UDP-N-acetylmuramoyl-tripeptide--D-alanyl-D-alanine ligase [bacterium]|nr:UDP-N-acetylmuramoyl-tripeptide--D-alanyl-D-alanine ligase [bacterium]
MHDLYTAQTVAAATHGTLYRGQAGQRFAGVSTDTRSLRPHECFVALVGPNFNGHRFIEQALGQGATGLVISESVDLPPDTTAAVIRVPDTLTALGELARWTLAQRKIPVLAVTGSTGKTTTKEMLYEIMNLARPGKVLRNEGNFNNLIGLPLTVFRLTAAHEVAVLEMGMSMRGEIRRLAQIAQPNIGVITNVSAVHLEHLKTIGAVAEAKGELLENFTEQNTVVLNADDPRVKRMGEGKPFRCLYFSADPNGDAQVRALNVAPQGFEGIRATLAIGDETIEVVLSCFGRHNVLNALAAAGAAHAFGVDAATIARGLEAFRPPAMRSRVLNIFGVTVIDDTYNANPRSMDAALAALAELAGQGRKVAVLGDMFELGDETQAAHRRLGRHAAKTRLDRLILLGEQAEHVADGAREEKMDDAAISIFDEQGDIVNDLRAWAQRGDVILVKGSRGMRMERIVRGLKGEAIG